jgi:septal ring factor EnvC (AmiA/AmiB activator)
MATTKPKNEPIASGTQIDLEAGNNPEIDHIPPSVITAEEKVKAYDAMQSQFATLKSKVELQHANMEKQLADKQKSTKELENTLLLTREAAKNTAKQLEDLKAKDIELSAEVYAARKEVTLLQTFLKK